MTFNEEANVAGVPLYVKVLFFKISRASHLNRAALINSSLTQK